MRIELRDADRPDDALGETGYAAARCGINFGQCALPSSASSWRVYIYTAQ